MKPVEFTREAPCGCHSGLMNMYLSHQRTNVLINEIFQLASNRAKQKPRHEERGGTSHIPYFIGAIQILKQYTNVLVHLLPEYNGGIAQCLSWQMCWQHKRKHS